MRKMMMVDFAVMRKNMVQLLGICVFVGLVMSVGMGNLAVATACIAAMIPLEVAFSAFAYDEMNGWQTFRLALPLSRADIVKGRYAGVLALTGVSALFGLATAYLLAGIAALLGPSSPAAPLLLEHNPHEGLWVAAVLGACVSLLMVALMMPFAMRTGLTRAVRNLPLVLVLVLLAGFILFSEDGPLAGFVPSFAPGDASFPLLVAVIAAGALAAYLASLAITLRLYATREL